MAWPSLAANTVVRPVSLPTNRMELNRRCDRLGRAKTGGGRGPQGQAGRNLQASRQLARGLRTGIAVRLRPECGADGRRAERRDLQFQVSRLAVAPVIAQACIVRTVTRIALETAGRDRAFERSPIRADRKGPVVFRMWQATGPGRLIAGDLPIVFLPVLEAHGQGPDDALVEGTPRVQVQRELIEADTAAVAGQRSRVGDDLGHRRIRVQGAGTAPRSKR